MTVVGAGVPARLDQTGVTAVVPDDPAGVVAAIFDPSRRGELYPLYHRLRSTAPVIRSEDPCMPGVWMITTHADALALYRSSQAVSDPATAEHFNHGGAGGPFYRVIRDMMLFLPADEHARVRRLVARAFTPKAVAQVRPLAAGYARQLLASCLPGDEMDLVSGFAYQLPIRVIAHLMGIEPADFPIIEALAYDFARGSEGGGGSDQRARAADQAAVGFTEYFEALIARRRRDPRADIISALIGAEEDGRRLDHSQVVANAILLLQAGHETTTDAIGNAMVALFRHPEQLEHLRRSPGATAGAVEELLRFDPTNQMNNRLLLAPVRLSGVELSPGEQVVVMIGAANRDPALVADPDRLVLGRPVLSHLAFAHGVHYCLGAALARAELGVALRSLLDGLRGLRPARETFAWRDTLRNRGPASLMVTWDAVVARVTTRLRVAIPIFDGLTALDAVGPYEVLQRIPSIDVILVGAAVGVVRTDNGMLGLHVDAPYEQLADPEVLVVPGGVGTRPLQHDPRLLGWLRQAHATSTFTTSVCTGSLLLGAAGLLAGLRATTHWSCYGELEAHGAVVVAERVVENLEQRIITAVGVSAGIDMALRLVELLVDATGAEAAQLMIEYDPAPPFRSGSPRLAGEAVVARATEYAGRRN